MNIMVDGEPLLKKQTGIGRYTKLLIDHLSQIDDLKVQILFNRVLNTSKYRSYVDHHYLGKRVTSANRRYPYKLIRHLGRFGRLLYRYPIDLFSKSPDNGFIFHATNFITLPTIKAINIVTVHDLAFLRYPETTDERIYRHHTTWLPYSLKQADHIIVDSYQTKQDLIDYLSVEEHRISVVYLAADEKFTRKTDEEIKKVRKKYALPDSYILFVGTVEPRKNLITLIEAFSILRDKYHVKEKLVVVGARGWKSSSLFRRIDELHIGDNVIFTGYVDDRDLPAAYSGASIFVFPSLYEGFGLPILEAMQCEVPVVASSVSSIPEVLGDAGILVNPFDADEWAESIYGLLQNEMLRGIFVQRGLKRVSNYSWRKVAEETLSVYRMVLNRKTNLVMNREAENNFPLNE